MMGREKPPQPALFYHHFNLEERVRKDHVLRKVSAAIDFDYIYDEVGHLYGVKGHESVPPPVILKLMLLLFFYNVRSERELMATIPERLDWLWFLGLDLDSSIPDHSVLSKARARWGVEAFRGFFERIVLQCNYTGLIDGRKIFADSSLIRADASLNSIVDRESLGRHINTAYQELERRLEKDDPSSNGPSDHGDDPPTPRKGSVNTKFISTTDPDSALVRRGKGGAEPTYQSHRAIDSAYGVVTAVETGPGDENEAHRLTELLDGHASNTGRTAEIAVADSKYGTNENLLACHDRGVTLHANTLRDVQAKRSRNKDIFPESAFRFDHETDTYICPAGARLYRRRHHADRAAADYVAPLAACLRCDLRPHCTKSQTSGRSIKRHDRQDDLDVMHAATKTRRCRSDLHVRQHFMERCFAQATRYGFKRARYRRRWRVEIQDLFIATIQNIELIVRYGKSRPAAVLAMPIPLPGWNRLVAALRCPIREPETLSAAPC